MNDVEAIFDDPPLYRMQYSGEDEEDEVTSEFFFDDPPLERVQLFEPEPSDDGQLRIRASAWHRNIKYSQTALISSDSWQHTAYRTAAYQSLIANIKGYVADAQDRLILDAPNVEARRLRARWTFEAADDPYDRRLDEERMARLTQELAEAITREIDNEIIRMFRDLLPDAPNTNTWFTTSAHLLAERRQRLNQLLNRKANWLIEGF